MIAAAMSSSMVKMVAWIGAVVIGRVKQVEKVKRKRSESDLFFDHGGCAYYMS
jgi:hypothetical protein